jgi:hypothetical protein
LLGDRADRLGIVIDETFERIADAAYLSNLASQSMADLRDRRADCQRVEDRISFVRRLAQGRLDIVREARQRRAAGFEPADVAALLASLPETLAGGVGRGRRGRSTSLPDLDDSAPAVAELDALCPPADLARLGDLDDHDLADLEAALTTYEHRVSAQRTIVFARLDTLADELANRYRSGETNVDSLLG